MTTPSICKFVCILPMNLKVIFCVPTLRAEEKIKNCHNHRQIMALGYSLVFAFFYEALNNATSPTELSNDSVFLLNYWSLIINFFVHIVPTEILALFLLPRMIHVSKSIKIDKRKSEAINKDDLHKYLICWSEVL